MAPETSKPVMIPEASGVSSAGLARLDAAMNAEIAAKRKAGMVVLIARNGIIVHEKAFGFANSITKVPMRTDMLFRLYSQTKPVTSVALLMLVEEGRLKLTDPLAKYIPEFGHAKVATGLDPSGQLILEAAHRPITVQDVFRHTAGFGTGREEGPVSNRYAAVDQADIPLAQLVMRLAALPLAYQPGTQWQYGPAHDVQGYLVELVSGMPLEGFLETRIFKPLRMNDTSFGFPAELSGRFPAIHAQTENGIDPIPADGEDVYARYGRHPRGGAGLSMTAHDYFRFAQMLANGGTLDGERLLGRATVDLMFSDQLPPEIKDMSLGDLRPFDGMRYGLGIGLLTDPVAAGVQGTIGTGSWAGYGTTQAYIDRKEKLVAIVMTQQFGDFEFLKLYQGLVYQAID